MQPLDRGEVGARGFLALQRLEGGSGKSIVDGAQAVGPLRMPVARVVQKAGGMGEEQRRHGPKTWSFKWGGAHSSLTRAW